MFKNRKCCSVVELNAMCHEIGKHDLKASVRNTRGMCPKRTEMSTSKIRNKLLIFKLLDLTALVAGKITSVYCLIFDILGQNVIFFAIINQP